MLTIQFLFFFHQKKNYVWMLLMFNLKIEQLKGKTKSTVILNWLNCYTPDLFLSGGLFTDSISGHPYIMYSVKSTTNQPLAFAFHCINCRAMNFLTSELGLVH